MSTKKIKKYFLKKVLTVLFKVDILLRSQTRKPTFCTYVSTKKIKTIFSVKVLTWARIFDILYLLREKPFILLKECKSLSKSKKRY